MNRGALAAIESVGGRRAPLSILLLLCAGAAGAAAPREIDLATAMGVLQIHGEEDRDLFGQGYVASCDVNGDGIEDAIFSATEADGPLNLRPLAGEAYLVYGRRGAWAGSYLVSDLAAVHFYGADDLDDFGRSLACGDVNDDGYADILIGAPNGNGIPGRASGQAYLILGGPSLPPVIDVRTNPGIVLWGEGSGDSFTRLPLVADVNGDGIGDLILDASSWQPIPQSGVYVGRVHIVFGRSTWPSQLDMAVDSNVKILGNTSRSDDFGSRIAAGDLDSDGIADIASMARLADGSDGTRPNAGNIYVFRGRTIWPSVIDLTTTPADMMVYGADPEDQAGRGLSISDLDGDGFPELDIGSDLADGPSNDMPETGEARTYRPGSVWPPTVDLAVSTDTIVYGVDPGDSYCLGLVPADVNGDSYPDLICGANLADGPDNTRNEAGEVMVDFGGPGRPVVSNMANGDHEFVVYGNSAYERLRVSGASDLNGDGIREVVVNESRFPATTPGTVWILSPVDTDRDGVENLPDNCALTYNTSQADRDGDLLGDACDNCPDASNATQQDTDDDSRGDACDSCPGQPGWQPGDPDGDGIDGCVDNCPSIANPGQSDSDFDGIGDACDGCPAPATNDADGDGICESADKCPGRSNRDQRDADGDGRGDACDVCPSNPDPTQADRDRDGAGDACDCQPDDGNDLRPVEVPWVSASRPTPSTVRLSWTAVGGADAYSITRGTLPGLSAGAYGSCVANGVASPTFDDAEVPPPGSGFTYLVSGQGFECGTGSLGTDSTGAPRANGSAGACTGVVVTEGRATSETTVYGTKIGSYTATLSSNDDSESITETLSGGNPSSRFSRLEHRWTFQVTGGSRVELHVEGTKTRSSDADGFAFEVSTNGGTSWTPFTMRQMPLADLDTDLIGVLPPGTAGAVLVRVVDTDRTAGNQSLDTVAIDEVFVRTVP